MLSLHGAGLVCLAVGTAVFLNTLGNKFCFDDFSAIEQNEDLRATTPWTNLIWNDFWGTPMHMDDSHKSYRPLCVATFRLNYLLHELQPMGYHLVNVLLHGAVCYLYVQLCSVVFGQVWPALIAGLLFAVHPIHTEAVAGLVGRADVLSGMFLIFAVLFYRKAAIATISAKGWLYFVLSVASFLCAAVSKEIGLTATALCIIYEVLLLRKLDVWSGLQLLHCLLTGKWHKIPGWFGAFLLRCLLLFTFTILFLYVRVSLNKGPPLFSVDNNPAMFEPSPYRQLHWAYLASFNFWLLLCPAHLSAEYAMGTIPLIKSFTDPRNALTFVTLPSLLVLILVGMTRSSSSSLWRTVMFAVSTLVVPFLPASNLFFPVGFVVAERVLYLPSMGFCMLVALGVWRLVTSFSHCKHTLLNQFIKLSIFYLLVTHTAKTVVRNRAWFSSLDLFASAVSTYPNNGKMVSNFASQLDMSGNRTLAIALFQHSIALEPYLVTGYMNLAYTQREMEQYLDALETYRKAAHLVTRNLEGDKKIHITPKNIRVYNSLSNMLREHGNDLTGALLYARKAVKWEPDWANTHNTLANALFALEKYGEAKVEFKRALDLNPEMVVAHSNLGECLLKMGDLSVAEEHFRLALTIQPNHTLTKFRLASVAIKLDRPSEKLLHEAEALLHDVVSVEPSNGNASFSLGLIYHDLRNYTEAEKWFLRSLELTPNDAGSLYNLGVIHTESKRYEEALVYLEELRLHHPTHMNGLCQQATCHMQLGHREQARQLFEEVLRKKPNNTMALQNYGLLLIHDKDYDRAITQFEHFYQLDPSNTAIKQQLDNLLKHRNQMQRKSRPPTNAS